ncbi:MAG: hypothetical protein ACLUR5_02900 [Eubacterium ventriosum]
MVFVICGFEHSVANMSYISGGLFKDGIWKPWLGNSRTYMV